MTDTVPASEWCDLPPEVQAIEDEAELAAEFAMSWVCGGGRAEDAATAFRLYRGGQ